MRAERYGATSMPHRMNPVRKIPLEWNALAIASANQADAKTHRAHAHAHIPRYEQYVKNGSLYGANRDVAGLLKSSESAVARNAADGERRWCSESR